MKITLNFDEPVSEYELQMANQLVALSTLPPRHYAASLEAMLRGEIIQRLIVRGFIVFENSELQIKFQRVDSAIKTHVAAIIRLQAELHDIVHDLIEENR